MKLYRSFLAIPITCTVVALVGALAFYNAHTTPPTPLEVQRAVIAEYIERLDPGLRALRRCIERARVLDRALTDEEITQIYTEVHGKRLHP